MKKNRVNRYFRLARPVSSDFDPMTVRGTSSPAVDSSTATGVVYVSGDPLSPDCRWVNLGNSSFARSNSDRASRYSAIQGALHTMAGLPPSHSFHVDAEAAQRASDLLGLMWENFEIDPPKVIPQDGEAVVFTWDHGDVKRYVTIDGEEIDVMDLNRKLQIKCLHDLPTESEHIFADLVTLVGMMPSSTTMDRDV